MTLSKTLRDKVRKKLGVSQATFYNLIRAKSKSENVADQDIGLLLLAYDDADINVRKSQFAVPQDKLELFVYHLARRSAGGSSASGSPPTIVRRGRSKKLEPTRGQNLLNFKGRTPSYPYHVFYSRLEDEINTAYRDKRLPNATLVLSRKLVENLVFNLLQSKFGSRRLELYFIKARGRALDFSILVDNLKLHIKEFPEDQQILVEKFGNLVEPFRTDANRKIHQVIEYLNSIAQIRKYKIPEMVEILIELISQVRGEKK